MWKQCESKLKIFNYFLPVCIIFDVAQEQKGLLHIALNDSNELDNAEQILCHFRLVPRYLYFAASPRYFGNCIFVCALYCRKKKNEE